MSNTWIYQVSKPLGFPFRSDSFHDYVAHIDMCDLLTPADLILPPLIDPFRVSSQQVHLAVSPGV